jgi:hypothetical protein
MKLIIRRNQADVKGMFGGHKGVKFSLFGQCHISDAEKALIDRYKVGEYVLADYKIKTKSGEAIDFDLTINGIIAGRNVETGDLYTLQELEKSMKEGCANMKNMLLVMATFGGEEVFEI